MCLNLQLLSATLLALSGAALLFCGFYVAPRGEIHSSVLVAFGEIATFAGALFGVDYCYRRREESRRKIKEDDAHERDK